MTYSEFVEKVSKELPGYCLQSGNRVLVEPKHVEKLQGCSYFGISVQQENKGIAVCINLKDFYAWHCAGDSFERLMQALATKVAEMLPDIPSPILELLSDYERMKKSLGLELVPREKNKELLDILPHEVFVDMALVYRFLDTTREEVTNSILLTNDLMRHYGIDKERLHADALYYAQKNYPPRLLDIMDGDLPLPLPKAEREACRGKMYVADLKGSDFGASVLFYPDFLESAANTLGGSFYILPSSIHELLFIPEDLGKREVELRSIVSYVNQKMVSAEDFLSDTVYHYDASSKRLEPAFDYEQSLA